MTPAPETDNWAILVETSRDRCPNHAEIIEGHFAHKDPSRCGLIVNKSGRCTLDACPIRRDAEIARLAGQQMRKDLLFKALIIEFFRPLVKKALDDLAEEMANGGDNGKIDEMLKATLRWMKGTDQQPNVTGAVIEKAVKDYMTCYEKRELHLLGLVVLDDGTKLDMHVDVPNKEAPNAPHNDSH